eukprot:gene7240-7654_t
MVGRQTMLLLFRSGLRSSLSINKHTACVSQFTQSARALSYSSSKLDREYRLPAQDCVLCGSSWTSSLPSYIAATIAAISLCIVRAETKSMLQMRPKQMPQQQATAVLKNERLRDMKTGFERFQRRIKCFDTLRLFESMDTCICDLRTLSELSHPETCKTLVCATFYELKNRYSAAKYMLQYTFVFEYVGILSPRQPNERHIDVGLDRYFDKPATFGIVKESGLQRSLFAHTSKGEVVDDDDAGLISYAEFLFLLTLLSASPRQFELAFRMFDEDGNGTVDLNEFENVRGAVQSSTATGRRIHQKDHTSLCEESISRSYIIQQLFGRKGQGKCNLRKFHTFFEEVQRDVLHIDFLRNKSDSDSPTITEKDLAKMILQYARLSENDRKEHLHRITASMARANAGIDNTFQPGLNITCETENFLIFTTNYVNMISWEEVEQLFKCLRNVDELALAFSLYSAAGTGITPVHMTDEFSRACVAVSGVYLSRNVTNFIFHMFDKDASIMKVSAVFSILKLDMKGDGKLSESEFLAVMKDARSRGLNKDRNLPIGRGFSALVKCIKFQMSQKDEL